MSEHQRDFEDLMLSYLKGELTPEETQQLLIYIKSHPSYHQRYGEMVRAYSLSTASRFAAQKADNLKKLHEALNMGTTPKKRSGIRRLMVRWQVAAMWMLLVGCAAWLGRSYFHQSPQPYVPAYCQIEIPKGASSRLLLPDSTLVCLNGGTVLKYDATRMAQAERSIYLEGEAYFEVAKHPERPFIVHTEGIDVKVTGTIFNVSSYADEEDIEVSLVEGEVHVYNPAVPDRNVVLLPNQQAIYHKANQQLLTKQIDPHTQISWVTGRLVFLNETLHNVLQIIAKQYNVEIVTESSQSFSEVFSGSIDASLTLEEILSLIDVDHKFMWKKTGKRIVVTDKY